MKKLLKYLLLVVVAAAFASGAEGRVSVETTEQQSDIYLYGEAFELSLSAPRIRTFCATPGFFCKYTSAAEFCKKIFLSH